MHVCVVQKSARRVPTSHSGCGFRFPSAPMLANLRARHHLPSARGQPGPAGGSAGGDLRRPFGPEVDQSSRAAEALTSQATRSPLRARGSSPARWAPSAAASQRAFNAPTHLRRAADICARSGGCAVRGLGSRRSCFAVCSFDLMRVVTEWILAHGGSTPEDAPYRDAGTRPHLAGSRNKRVPLQVSLRARISSRRSCGDER
jgi:hypothetical protein